MCGGCDACMPADRENTKALMAAFPPVFDKILACLSLGLGFPEDHFKKVPLCMHA